MAFFLEREKTTSTPYVLIDEERNYMKFTGRSFQEGVIDFFEPIVSWLDTYTATDFGSFTFDCGMDYFNSSTVKILSNIIKKLDQHSDDNHKVIVNWITTEDNDIIIECGEDFEEDVNNLTFNLVIE